MIHKSKKSFSHLEDYLDGGKIPGQPEVPGDSKENDKVHIMASPGEVVIPRSIATHPNAPELTKKYMQLHNYFSKDRL